MLILAVAFLFVALGHPETSFPWGQWNNLYALCYLCLDYGCPVYCAIQEKVMVLEVRRIAFV